MNLKYRKLWLLIGWGMVLLICFLSLTPNPPELGFNLWDKVNHFIAYAGMMGWFGQLYMKTSQRLTLAVAIIILGIVLEVVQGMGGYRMFEYHDMLANILGVIIALVIIYLKGDRVLYWLEQNVLKVS